MSKKKIYSFEFAIMQIADPEEAKNYEPYTEEEVMNQRIENISSQANNLRITTNDYDISKEE